MANYSTLPLMKHPYSLLLAGTALMLAGSLSAQVRAQSKGASARLMLTAPGANTHAHGVTDGARGSAPANDECSSVSTQVLPLGGSLDFTGDNTGATETNDFVAGSGLEGFGAVVWHKFSTSGCADITLSYCGTASVFQNVAAFLAHSCPATDADYTLYSAGNFTDCADGNATIVFTGVPAGEYYLPVLNDPDAPAVGPYTIHVTATACPTPPANDDCANAAPLAVNNWCNYSYYTGLGATESLAAITCNSFTGDANDDVWFSFVATSANMIVTAQGNDDGDGDNNTGYDAVMELFSGACGSLNSLTCQDSTLGSEPEQLHATGLTVGQTYFVRVYDWYSGSWPDMGFGICLVEGTNVNIGVQEFTNASDWTIFPNPGTGVFNLQYTGATAKGLIEVCDVAGRVVYSEQLQLGNGTVRDLDLSGLASGTYGVRLTVNGARSVQRLMVK